MNTTTDGSNPYAPPKAHVQDIKDSDQQQLASRGARLGAALLDGFIGSVLIYVPVLATGALKFGPDGVDYQGLFGLGGALGVLGFLIYMGLTIHFVLKNRQTIGKRLLGIKVVRSDGSQITIARLFWLRNVIILVLAVIPIVTIITLVDALWIFGQRRQCLHDKFADSIVINA